MIEIKVQSPIHKAQLKYEEHFGVLPLMLSGRHYIGKATESEIITELENCIKKMLNVMTGSGFLKKKNKLD